jgi:hypothetical protein
MKTHQLIKRFPSAARAIPPGEAQVPQEVVQDSCFHGHPRRQQIVHLHGDQGRQCTQLRTDPYGSYQGKSEKTEVRVRGHASLSSL